MPTPHNFLYQHEKAEEFDPDQNHTDKEPGEIHLTNLPEKEFKIKVITMLMELHRKMQVLTDKVGRENTEIQQSLKGLKNRLDEVQEAVNGIEFREQEHRETEVEEIKGSPGRKEY